MVEILQLMQSSFPEVLFKGSVMKNFSKFKKKQPYGGVLSKEAAIRRCSVKRKDVLKDFAKFTEKKSLPESLF